MAHSACNFGHHIRMVNSVTCIYKRLLRKVFAFLPFFMV